MLQIQILYTASRTKIIHETHNLIFTKFLQELSLLLMFSQMMITLLSLPPLLLMLLLMLMLPLLQLLQLLSLLKR